ncbi:MAG: hypothetical protein ACOYX5_12300 [Actinomycetota bacterium]
MKNRLLVSTALVLTLGLAAAPAASARTAVPAPQPAEIPQVTGVDLVSRYDVLSQWDTGELTHEAKYGDSWMQYQRQGSFFVPTKLRNGSATRVEATLNETMQQYFRIDEPPSGLWVGAFLERSRDDAPMPPKDYWTKDWFEVDFVIDGWVEDDNGNPVYAPPTPEGVVDFERFEGVRTTTRFAPPTKWMVKVVKKNARASSARLRAGGSVCIAPNVRSRAVHAGSGELQFVSAPAAVRRHFTVRVSQLSSDFGPQFGQVCVKARNPKRLARAPRQIPLTVRMAALNRSNVQVHSAPTVLTISWG